MIDLGKTTMTPAEIDAYLRHDGLFAAVACLRRDGSPFVIPLGYYYDGSFLYFSTTPTRGLVKRLRHDPRVSVAVFDHEPIHGYVLVNDVAQEIPDTGDVLSLRMHRRGAPPVSQAGNRRRGRTRPHLAVRWARGVPRSYGERLRHGPAQGSG